ncbi:MAG: RnfABCDGE type electron transport complex subunit G [Rikenellaceae bacterium]
MESNLKNMVLVLVSITLIASSAVGVVYTLTKEPIKLAKEAKLNDAIVEVLPTFSELLPVVEVEVDGEKVNVYPAKNGDKTVGYAVESFSKNGFGGMIKILVGFTSDGTIFSTEVISHSETPGLGDKMDKNKSNFSEQFKGKDPAKSNLTVKKDGGDVDAITAATISSRAFTDAISNAYKAFQLSNK